MELITLNIGIRAPDDKARGAQNRWMRRIGNVLGRLGHLPAGVRAGPQESRNSI